MSEEFDRGDERREAPSRRDEEARVSPRRWLAWVWVVPAVAAGFLAVHGAGLTGAARDYGAALLLLAAFALAALTRARRAAAR